MIKLFSFKKRKKKPERELAPQLTTWQRRALEVAGVPPAGLPYTTYDEMEKDSMVQTCLTVKKLGVVASQWRIVSGEDGECGTGGKDGEDGKVDTPHFPRSPHFPSSSRGEAKRRADFVAEAFARMEGSPHTILLGAMDAFAKGWSVQEIVYEGDLSTDGREGWRMGGREGWARVSTNHRITDSPAHPKIWIKAVRPKDPSLFGLEMDKFGRLRELKLQLPGEAAIDVPRAKFVVYSNRGSYGRPKGRSDLDSAYRHWTSKQSLLSAWKFHLERFAMPTVLGRFERGLSAEEQASILSAMQNLSQHTAVIFPNEIEIDTLGGQKESSSGFMEALDFHNREIARAILGQTLTTDEGRRVGSLAMGKVHLQVLLLQLEAIRRELADVVMTEQVIRPLVELNFGPGPIPRFEFAPVPISAFATGELLGESARR